MSLVTLILGQIVSFSLFLYLARTLPEAAYGAFALSVTWLNIGSLFTGMGFGATLTRFTPVYLSSGSLGSLSGLLHRGSSLVASISILVSLITFVALEVNKENFSPETFAVLRIGLTALPAIALTTVVAGTLKGLGRTALSLLPDRVLRPAIVLGCSIVVPCVSTRGLTGSTAAWIYSAAALLSLLTAVWLLRTQLPAGIAATERTYRTREWVKAAGGILMTSSGYLLMSQSDTILVGTFLGAADAGVYFTASKVAHLIQFGLVAIQQVAAPMIAKFYAEGEREKLQKLLFYAWAGSAGFALIAGGTTVFISSHILALFGPEFADSSGLLNTLLIGPIILGLTGVKGLVLTMTGHQKQAAIIVGLSALLNIGLDLVLIPVAGAQGAAIATVVSSAAWSLPMVYFSSRHLGLNAVPLPSSRNPQG